MEGLFDLQLFAGEGNSGDGAGSGGGPVDGARNGQARSLRDGSEDVSRNGQARSLQAGGSESERDRAAWGGEEDTGMASGASGMPRPTDAQPEPDRAVRGTEDNARMAGASNRNASEQERDRAARGMEDNARTSIALKKHFQHLEAEAEQMREVFPGFDLRQELRDPRFAALTAPGMGVSVEDAYYALHRRELQAASMQVAARSAARKLASSIQSAARRPVENGGASSAPAGFSLRHMSREQREELRQRIRTAAALGEKIYP